MLSKTIKTALITFMACITVQAQEWTKIIGTNDNEYVKTILTLPNGDFLLGGSFYAAGDFYNGKNMLIRTDKLGNLVWIKYFGLTDSEGNNTHQESIVELQLAQDGNVMVLGSKQPPLPNSAGSYDLYLAKLTPDGNEVWRKDYDYGGSDWPKAFVQTSDGGFAIAAYTTSFSGTGSNSDILLLKLDPMGAFSWLQTFDENEVDDCGDVFEKTNGELVVVGTSQFAGMGNRFYLLATDANGQLLWEKSLLGPETVRPYAATALPDGSFYVVGTGSNALGALAPMTAKLMPTGELDWVTSCDGCQYGEHYGLLQCQEGGSFAVGIGGSSPFDGAVLQQLGADGNETWSSNLYQDPASTEFGIAATWATDGGILVLGNKLTPASGYDALLMKFKGLDCTPESFVSRVGEQPQSTSAALVYPNPTSGLAQLSIHGPILANQALLKVVSPSGGTVLQRQVEGPTVELDLTALPKGLYFLWLETEKGTGQRLRVVVE